MTPSHARASTVAAEAASMLALGLTNPPGDLPALAELAAALPAYAELEWLAHGGMGVVLRARHIKLDRRVAIKLLRPELASRADFSERFAREARAMAALQHPNIVGIHDFGEVLGVHYLVMEYVEGQSLRGLMAAGLSSSTALRIAGELYAALQYAHTRGVVHRDLKPENVLIDREGCARLTDFGLAMLIEPGESPRLTGTGSVLGTPMYMAPEQLETPGTVDHRADIFALGVVIYELLTGRLPLGSFEPPSGLSGLDRRVDALVTGALAHDPDRRIQSAAEVGDRVRALAPIAGAPPPVFVESWELMRDRARSRSAIGGIACIAGAFAMLLFGVGGPVISASGVLMISAALVLGCVGDVRRLTRASSVLREIYKARLGLRATAAGSSLVLAGQLIDAEAIGAGGWTLSVAMLAMVLASAAGGWFAARSHGFPAELVFGPRWWVERWQQREDAVLRGGVRVAVAPMPSRAALPPE